MLLDDLRKKHPALANDLLRHLKAIFACARRRHLVSMSPVLDFTALLDAGGPEKGHQRALSREEIAALFDAMRETRTFGRDKTLAVKLLLALCVRKSELLAAKWDEFDLDGDSDQGPIWRLPAERTKTGSTLVVPLADVVVEWLKALRTLASGGDYVFPARRRDPRARQPHLGTDTLNVAMTRLNLKLRPFTLRDLRRTARTQLAELGIRSNVAERCLNPTLRSGEDTYKRHDYFTERREALATWSTLLVELKSGRTNVIPIDTIKYPKNRNPAAS